MNPKFEASLSNIDHISQQQNKTDKQTKIRKARCGVAHAIIPAPERQRQEDLC